MSDEGVGLVDRITRRRLLALSAAFLAAPRTSAGQQKVYRIGWLSNIAPEDPLFRTALEALRQGLRERGYAEGRNIAFELRYAKGRYELFPELAAELVRLKVDVIVAASTPAALAARNSTRTIPIVMVAAGNPVETGLVASLARPGGNITGHSILAPEIVGKQLELLNETVPGLSRVAVLRNPGQPAHRAMSRAAEVAARALGLQPQVLDARSPDEFDSAFATMGRARVGAVLVLADAMFLLHGARLAALAAKSGLPAMYGFPEHAATGGLMAYAPNLTDLFRRAAKYVARILGGAKAADLPVEQPTKFDLVINLKTARALGLTIPPVVLLRADHVIE